MKKILFIVILFASNTSFCQEFGTLISRGKKGNIVYKIYSQREHFESFFKKAKKDSTDNYSLWKNIIYNKTKSYWDLEFKDYPDKDIETQKKNLFEFHSRILKQNTILETTKRFEDELESILKKTFDFYQNEKDTISVILIPIAGQGGTVKAIGENKSVMPLGINLIENSSNLNSIIPHEYTHRYNQQKKGFPADLDIWMKKSKMYWSLWAEGLATYGTGAVTNNFAISNVMLAKEYDSFSFKPELDSWLANQFLKQYSDALINFENDAPRAKWFASNSTDLREDLPPSIGYYLGYKVVKVSIEKLGYTFNELLTFKPGELELIGIKALKIVAITTTNKR